MTALHFCKIICAHDHLHVDLQFDTATRVVFWIIFTINKIPTLHIIWDGMTKLLAEFINTLCANVFSISDHTMKTF